MARRKSLMKRMFGRKFNIWDFIIITLILGSGYFIFVREGAAGLVENIVVGVFYALVIGFILRFVVSKSKK